MTAGSDGFKVTPEMRAQLAAVRDLCRTQCPCRIYRCSHYDMKRCPYEVQLFFKGVLPGWKWPRLRLVRAGE